MDVIDVKRELSSPTTDLDNVIVDPNGNTLMGSLADDEGRGSDEGEENFDASVGGGMIGENRKCPPADSDDSSSDDVVVAEVFDPQHQQQHRHRREDLVRASRDVDLPLASIEKALNRMTDAVANIQNTQDMLPGSSFVQKRVIYKMSRDQNL